MFDSGISVKNLVEELKTTEVDIALDIPDVTYASWINSLQQLLYTEVIKEQKIETVQRPETKVISISSLQPAPNENNPIFEDIYAIYADGIQLKKSTVASGAIFLDTFYKDNNDIGFNTMNMPTEVKIVYFVRPALADLTSHGNIKEADDNGNPINVMVPVEFIDLVKAKLRGEAYKLANEDSIAAKWLNDYNVLLETFRAWIAEKSPNFGM